ncbi:uncharacterized protein JNUCC1_02716 [Lentibacillus sp. JNUCC-1]|uniref:RDD family protein n=1 Tax=Lentibacillus sp. JNUCC-1 TaxID=2654513 RepID=UPI0012E770B5|nr:RDD family protein [Lentibacillus sp. JNUCC-1]MUV38845.1 uncharacterized protein [Lentibacillus sp. JNUCC-1]
MVSNPAGFWIRLGAIIIDQIFLFLALGIVGFLLFKEFLVEGFFVDAISSLYFVLLPIFWCGYTVGKKGTEIRIVREDGDEVGFGTMFLREVVGGFVYVLTLGIGVIVSVLMVGLREDKRSIHDFIAGTYVTYDEPD